MRELCFYVTLKVPDDSLSDRHYNFTTNYLRQAVQEMAEDMLGEVVDIEIKQDNSK